ncbi:MAG: hypothetical protein HFG78_06130 [Hungatella sp.]|nr:hypothetical protein [Hungatella sp.]
MILESLQSANSTILDSVQTTNNKQAAKNFKDQVIALNQCTLELEQLLNLIKAMQSKKLSSKVFTVEIKESLQDTVDRCGQKTSDHTLDTSTVIALKNSIELCRKNAEISWKEAAGDLSGDVENSLSSLRGLLSNKQEAEEILESLAKAKAKLPGSVKTIDTFLDNVKRGKGLIDGLHLDVEAEKFIVKVRTQQATVADLTPHIMDWLKENHLTGQIKVRF